MLLKLREVVPYWIIPEKPVIGVFGTSSKQGKFTLQLAMKSEFNRRGIGVDSIGTEH